MSAYQIVFDWLYPIYPEHLLAQSITTEVLSMAEDQGFSQIVGIKNTVTQIPGMSYLLTHRRGEVSTLIIRHGDRMGTWIVTLNEMTTELEMLR